MRSPVHFFEIDFSAVCDIMMSENVGGLSEKVLQFFNIFLLLRKHLSCMMRMKNRERDFYGKNFGCRR